MFCKLVIFSAGSGEKNRYLVIFLKNMQEKKTVDGE